MNEIVCYFKEKWNKAVFKKQEFENQVRLINSELSELMDREHNIEVQESNPDYVFRAECLEKDMNEKALDLIEERKNELKEKTQEFVTDIQKLDLEIERFKLLHGEAVKLSRSFMNKDLHDKLEFILGLMDSDIQRAKLELVSLLKEGAADAD